MDLGELILAGFGIYLVVGLGSALLLSVAGLPWIDPAAKGTGIVFRILAMPGIVAFWPLMLSRLLRQRPQPPEERNNHRHFAQGDSR